MQRRFIFNRMYKKQFLLPCGSNGKESPFDARDRILSLGQEDPLEKGMAIHSSILSWRIPWKRGLAGYSSWGRKESDTTEQLIHTRRSVSNVFLKE